MRALALLSFFLIALTASADDLSGTWTGSFNSVGPDGQAHDSAIHMVLKQTGTALTGTAGPSENQQWTLVDGKIDGDKVTFGVQAEQGPVLKFALTLAQGHLKGEASAEQNGQKFNAKIDATKKP